MVGRQIELFLSQKDTAFGKKFINIGAGFAFLIFYLILFSYFINPLFKFGTLSKLIDEGNPDHLSNIELFFRVSVLAPIWEEVVYRWAPGKLIRNFGEKRFCLPVMILSCAIFGHNHGSIVNIFIQGVQGFVIFSVYVKNNYSLTSAIILHSMLNLFFSFGIPAFLN